MKRHCVVRLILLTVALVAILGDSRAYGLSMATTAVSFPEVTLNGADQLVNGSTNPWQVDATGESGGWHITVAASDFTNGSGKTIPVLNLEVRLISSTSFEYLGMWMAPSLPRPHSAL